MAPKRTVTWKCPGCEACTVAETKPKGLCSVCGKCEFELWNIVEDTPPAPLIQVGPPDVPVARWLEDRSEQKCLLCNKPLAKLLPQGFVGLVLKTGYTFPIGAACTKCAMKESRGGVKIASILYPATLEQEVIQSVPGATPQGIEEVNP